MRIFEDDEEFPSIGDELKSPTRKFKNLVKSSQSVTRNVLQTSYAADSSWSDDLLPNEHEEVHPTSHSAKGRSIDQPRPAIQALRGKEQSRDCIRRKDPSLASEDDGRFLSQWRGGRRSEVRANCKSLSDGRSVTKPSTSTTTTTTDNDDIDAIFHGAGATAVADLPLEDVISDAQAPLQGASLVDHACMCDLECWAAMCSSIDCRGRGSYCEIAEVAAYDSDSDYCPCDEFEGLDTSTHYAVSSSARGPSPSEMISCSCDRRVVGPLCSHVCRGPF